MPDLFEDLSAVLAEGHEHQCHILVDPRRAQLARTLGAERFPCSTQLGAELDYSHISPLQHLVQAEALRICAEARAEL